MAVWLLVVVAAIVQPAGAQESGTPDDPFRYLENLSDQRTQAFLGEQAARTRATLDAIPERNTLAERIRTLSESMASVTGIKLAAGRVFYLKLGSLAKTPVLCMRDGLSSPERVILDPERLAASGETASIAWYAPSPDGRHIAYGLSRGGREPLLKVLGTEKRADLPVEIDRARFNAGLAWHPDGRSFYYARNPESGEGPRRYANIRIYRHVLGRDTARDEVVFAPGVGGARDVPEFVFPSLVVPTESRFAYAIAREGVRREIAVHIAEQKDLAAGRPHWRKIVGVEDEVMAIEAWRDDLFLLSRHGAPRHRVLRVNAAAPLIAKARVAIPQGDSVIEAMALARDALYLRTSVGGVDRLERLDMGLLGARGPEFLRTAFDTSISEMVTHPRRPGALLKIEGWVEAPRIVEVDARSGDLHDTKLQPPAAAEFSDMYAVRLYAPSHDGKRIPVTLIYPKSTQLTGDSPTLLIAYGSYGVSLSPTFDPTRLAWLERGGVLAFAHVRGGGENGDEWHESARGKGKGETIRDVVSAARFIIDYGFTNPKRLAMLGTGAGGIAVGGALVARPDLFAAVVARAPMLDLLRYESGAYGPPNVPELGSAATPAGAQALRALSPYHGVKDATAYPAVLLTTGASEPMVDSWHAVKMAARLQAASSGEKPILLRVDSPDPSRGERVQELADIDAFLLSQTGDRPQTREPGSVPKR